MLSATDICSLARGLAFFGSGGGGDTTYGALLAAGALEQHGPVNVIALDTVADDALVLPVAFLGAPSVGSEKLEGINSLLACIARARADAPERAVVLSVAELGGANGLAPFCVAGLLGLEVIDADLIGRAFPELQMASTTLLGPKVKRTVFAADTGDTVVLETDCVQQLERVGRDLAVAYGGSLAVIPQTLSGREAKVALLPGGLQRALEFGRKRELTGLARHLLRARVSWVQRRVCRGFVEGTVHLIGPQGPLEVLIRNEYLAVRVRGALVVASPDIVALIDADSGHIFTSDEIDTGAEVDVWSCRAAPLWYTPAGLALVGPNALGLQQEVSDAV